MTQHRLQGSSSSRLQLLVLCFLAPVRATGADCNGNGIADIEEVRSGALPDCNRNGVPDGCDITQVNYGLVSAGSFFVGHSPLEVIVDDIDGDGDMDIASSSNAGTEDVTIVSNDGSGRFGQPIRWAVGQVVDSLGAADLDMDGLKDLAVMGALGLTVLFQDQNRSFFLKEPALTLDGRAQGIALGDLDADLDIDLVAVFPPGARILRNEGSGFFSPLDRMTMGSAPVKVLASTLDGDEDLDLATCNITGAHVGNVSIFINHGDGSFEIPRNYATARDPSMLVTGDVDGDGDADLATTNQDMISILVGDGQARFTLSNELESEKLLFRLVSGDLDGGGYMDLAAAGGQGVAPAGASVYLNRGGAGFAHLADFSTGFPSDIRSSDMDGDGTLEIVLGDLDLAAVTILQRAEAAYATDCNSNLRPDDCELEGNDCNENELPDECDILSGFSIDCNANGVPDDCDIPGRGFGFETALLPTTLFTGLVFSSDLDADGRDDIYVATKEGDLLLFWNARPEGFLSESRIQGGSMVTDSTAVDLDGDGHREILLADPKAQGLRVLENQGNRTFVEGSKLSVPGIPKLVSAGDVDGDLDLDLVATSFDGTVGVFENRGAGAFGDHLRVGTGVSTHILEVADLDRDGLPDVVADSGNRSSILLFWNGGSIAFQDPTRIEPLFLIEAAAIADADADGDDDIFLAGFGRIDLFRNSGGRVFAVDSNRSPVNAVRGMVPGDLDLDGDQDLAVINAFDLSALLNRGGGALDDPVSIFSIMDTLPLPAAGDWNGDGAMDLATHSLARLVILTNVSRSPASRDTDSNRVPDECQQRPFHRGDANGDGDLNLTDPVFTLRYLFQGDRASPCLEAADTNNDGQLGITDPIATLDFLFRSGPPPAPPGPPPAPCGFDPDPSGSSGDIGCSAYEGCEG